MKNLTASPPEGEEMHRWRFAARLDYHLGVVARLKAVADDDWVMFADACGLLGVTETWLDSQVTKGRLDAFALHPDTPPASGRRWRAVSGLSMRRFHSSRVAPWKPIDDRWRIVTSDWLRVPESMDVTAPGWRVRGLDGRLQGSYEMCFLPVLPGRDQTMQAHRDIWLVDDVGSVIEGPFIDMRHVARTLRWRRR